MWGRVDRFGGLMLDTSVSAALLLAVACVAMLACQQPARRVCVARLAILGLLTLWPITIAALVPRWNAPDALRDAGLLSHPLVNEFRTAAVDQTEVGQSVSTKLGTLSRLGPIPLRLLLLAYGAALVSRLGWLVMGHIGLDALERGSVDPDPETLEVYDSLPFASRRMRPRLRVVARLKRPVLVGLFAPSILIPPEFEEPETHDRLRLGLLHELAHAEVGDPWFRLAGSVAQAFWFFLPPLWWLRAQMRLDQEFLADRRAAQGFGLARDYASSLIEFASSRVWTPAIVTHAAPHRDVEPSALFLRVLMLLRSPFRVETRPPATWTAAAALLAVLTTVGLSSLSVRPSGRPVAAARRIDHFHLARLHLQASRPSPNGRAATFELPVRLPAEFDLWLDLWGDMPTLTRMRVVGLPLEPVARDSESSFAPADWHTVRVRRDRTGVTLWIDGAVASLDERETLTTFLSVEPAPRIDGFVHQLDLEW